MHTTVTTETSPRIHSWTWHLTCHQGRNPQLLATSTHHTSSNRHHKPPAQARPLIWEATLETVHIPRAASTTYSMSTLTCHQTTNSFSRPFMQISTCPHLRHHHNIMTFHHSSNHPPLATCTPAQGLKQFQLQLQPQLLQLSLPWSLPHRPRLALPPWKFLLL